MTIDREKLTPFLLRIFTRENGFHRMNDFYRPEKLGCQIVYTWMDASLKELVESIQRNPDDTR